MDEDGTAIKVWEHGGQHSHPRPGGGALSLAEEEAVDNQVQRNPHASAHQLRTGTTAPGSIPLPKISQTLAKPSIARYQVAKSLARQGINSSSVKGGLSLIQSMAEFTKKLDPSTSFIVQSSLTNPGFFSVQTPWMKDIIKESVLDWTDNYDAGPDAGRHGFVTDGNHSYFRDGTLLTTCAFSSILMAWVPILYTWVAHLDIQHHRPHFNFMNRNIIEAAGDNFQSKFLLNVRVPFFILNKNND